VSLPETTPEPVDGVKAERALIVVPDRLPQPIGARIDRIFPKRN
jgi:hypothetical protein